MVVISVYGIQEKKIIYLFSLLSLSLSLSLFFYSQIFSSYKQILIFSSIILKHRDCILQSFKKVFSLNLDNKLKTGGIATQIKRTKNITLKIPFS